MEFLTENGTQKRCQKLSPEELFGLFSDSTDFKDILELFEELLDSLKIDKHEHKEVYSKLKTKLTSWKCQSLWDLLDSRAKHAEYEHGKVCNGLNVLIIGAGPIGLRTAIETALLGCKTVIVEKRTSFTRNNVLHLWPFLLTDFRSLGAKKFYGKFCAGSIDHISIKQLQSILLKVCLILGIKVIPATEFKELVEPVDGKGWKGLYNPQRDFLSNFEFDVIIGADGKKDILPGFPQIEMRGALAIGITCNFVNENTMAEAGVEEISGIAYQFNPKFFDDLREKFDVGLENIVYYKDVTHYFVMTVLKSSLLERGALKQDYADPSRLLEKQNIDHDKLVDLTMDTVHYATNYKLPSTLKLAKNPNGTPDIAVFDFTSLKKATNASRIVERKGKRLLMALVGDSLLQPFWPTGSGCGRGVLSSLDAAWMVRLFGMSKPPLTVLWEREKIFKLLSGTDSQHLQKNYKSFTIDPKTRYSNLNHTSAANIPFLKKLYDTDDPENADYSIPESLICTKFEVGRAATMHPPRSRRKSIGKRRSHSAIVHKRRSDRTTLKEAKHVSKAKAVWEDKVPKNSQIGGPSKRTRPSESRSGSSGLSSVSESDREEPTGPYQRAQCLRKRNQSSELSDVFSGSSTEGLDVLEDSSQVLLHDKEKHAHDKHRALGHKHVHTSGDRLAYKHGHDDKHAKGHGGVMRFFFGRGKGDHVETERRKSVAARKSLSRARRLRRKSGLGSQSKSEDEEKNSLLKHKENLKSVTVRKRPNREPRTDDSDRDATSTHVGKANDNEKRSAKELIAAAEARDLKTAGASKTDSLKRKADDVISDEKTSRFENVSWKHHLPAIQPFLPEDEETGPQPANSVKNASQLAGLLLLAVPLLLPCRAKTTGKPSNMFAEKRNSFVRSSTEKRETRKISLTRAGSVQRAVENWNKSKQEPASTRDFHEFKRNRSSGSLKKDGLLAAGNRWSFHGRATEDTQPPSASSSFNTDDYEIIEMKGCSLQPKELLRVEDDFDVISGSEYHRDETDWFEKKRGKKMTKTTNKKKKPVEILKENLSELCQEQRPSSVIISLEILLGIHKAIISNTNVDKFYRIYTRGKDFENYVWNIEACRSFLKQVGWQICGKFIVLSKSTSVHEALDCIEDAKRSTERVLQSKTSVQEKTEGNSIGSSVPKINVLSEDDDKNKQFNSVKRTEDSLSSDKIEIASSLRPEFISKEELSQLDDSIDEKNWESVDDEEDDVESSERFIGEEEYLIVDFAKSQTEDISKKASGVKLKRSRHVMAEDAYGKDGRRRRKRSAREAEEREADKDDGCLGTDGNSRQRRREITQVVNNESSSREGRRRPARETAEQDANLGNDGRTGQRRREMFRAADKDEITEETSSRRGRSLRERMMMAEGTSDTGNQNKKQGNSQLTKQGSQEWSVEIQQSSKEISQNRTASVQEDSYGPDGRRRRRSGGQKREAGSSSDTRADKNNTATSRSEEIKQAGRARDRASIVLNMNNNTHVVEKAMPKEKVVKMEGVKVRDEVLDSCEKEKKITENNDEIRKLTSENLQRISGLTLDELDGEGGKKKKKKLVVKKGSLRKLKLQQNGELVKDEKRSLKKSGLLDVEKNDLKTEYICDDKVENNGDNYKTEGKKGFIDRNDKKLDVYDGKNEVIEPKKDLGGEEKETPKTNQIENGLSELRISEAIESMTKGDVVQGLISNVAENKGKEIVYENGDSKVMIDGTAEQIGTPKREKKRKLVLKVKRKKDKTSDVISNGDSDHNSVDSIQESIDSAKDATDNKIESKTEKVPDEKPETLKQKIIGFEENNPQKTKEDSREEPEKVKKKKFVLKRKKKV